MFVVNQAEEAFPLRPLRLGDGEFAVNGVDWDVEMLESNGCVAVWKEKGSPRLPKELKCDLFDENVPRREKEERFWEKAFGIYYDEKLIGICEKDQERCTVSTPAQASYRLFIAKRDEDSLFVVNLTTEAFPLASLRLGDDERVRSTVQSGV